MHGVEAIESESKLLALVVRGDVRPDGVRFYTPDDATLQVGLLEHPQGHSVPAHVHVPARRVVGQTFEVLHVRSGKIEVTLYDLERQPLRIVELVAGDTILLSGAGHGIRILEDTLMLEVKQGPYLGVNEKERFDS